MQTNSHPATVDGPANLLLLRALEEVLGSAAVLTGGQIPSAHTHDWTLDRVGRCLAVLRPDSTEAVSRICSLCNDAGVGIIPQGGHTGLVGGAQRPTGDCFVLSLGRLNRIEDIDPENMTCTVQAGVILETLQAELAEHRLAFGVSIGSQGTAQIGGLVSTNAGGVRVVRHGMTSAHVLGLEMVLADGRVVSSISGLHKDNRGPDPLRIAIGGEGAFGVVTKACLRLHPQQKHMVSAYVGCDSFGEALELFRRFRAGGFEVLSAFEVMSDACTSLARLIHPDLVPPVTAPVHVLVELTSACDIPLGDIAETLLSGALDQGLASDAVIAQSGAQAARFWAIREGLVEGHSRRGYHVRSDVSVRLGLIPEAVETLEAMLAAEFPGWISQAYGHMGDGNIHFNALPPEGLSEPQARAIGPEIEAHIFGIVRDLDGSFSAEHGVGRTKADWFCHTMPDRYEMLERIKLALDPAGIMNPGCLLHDRPETE